MLTRRHLLAGASALASAASTRADAQAGYPSGPIKMLVSYPAGGGVDIVARLLGEPIQSELGQSVVVENRTGALATIAAEEILKTVPRGGIGRPEDVAAAVWFLLTHATDFINGECIAVDGGFLTGRSLLQSKL